MQIKKDLIFIVTFLVSFCTIIYELVYAQLLTVIFGGTVLRYSITIGLFLFCLGIGSFLYNYLEHYDKKKFFVFVEIGLSVVGFFGIVFIICLNSYFAFLPHLLRVILSNIPIAVIGILSGLDLPLLSYFAGEKSSAYSQVLGVDYFGSLVGTIVYSLVLYPHQGLIFSSAIVAITNLFVALLLFVFLYRKKNILLTVLFSFLILVFILILANITLVSDYLMKVYLSNSILSYYSDWFFEGIVASVKEVVFTPYQMIFLYSIVLNQGTIHELNNTCMNLDQHLQLCDSWAHEYHAGLVDVPMAFFENTSNMTVLLIGGGDGIAVNYLSKYGVYVDQVDIDKEFIEYGKSSEFVSKYQNNSFDYPLLNLTIGDGFAYIRNTQKKYDLIILDLPGLKEDKLLPLYSKEFFLSVNRVLNDKGIAITWIYSFKENPEYEKVLMNTLAASDFKYFINYSSYKIDETRFPIEDYLIFSNSNDIKINTSKSEYTSQLSKIYSSLSWDKFVFSDDAPINSVFKPSYKILIK